ncbi:MAG TPA: phospholipase D family protein [Nevskiaceae bacterium]
MITDVLLIAAPVVVVLSVAAFWQWTRLSTRRSSTPGTALPAAAACVLDRIVQPLLQAHLPGESAAVLLSDPVAAFGARLHTARVAGRSIDVQYYVWHHDSTGQLLERELRGAADRGVRVRMLVDDMNVAGKDSSLLALDAHPRIEVRLFNPTRSRGLLRLPEFALHLVRLNRRMHNKAWIVDNRVAIVGGRNIGDEYFGAAPDTNFQDTDLLLIGPAVAGASAIFDAFWNAPSTIPVRLLHRARDRLACIATHDRLRMHPDGRFIARTHAIAARNQFIDEFAAGAVHLHWSASLRVLSDPPEKAATPDRARDRPGWLLYDINALLYSARHESLMIAPYFVPGVNGTLLLTGQVRRGMHVGVLTNSLAATDVTLVHAGYFKYRRRLLEHGVQLHELRPERRDTRHRTLGSRGASLHSKAFVIDGRRGFVGSFNLDPRSARLNTEMGVVFDDAGLAAELTDFFTAGTQPKTAWEVMLTGAGALRWHGYGGEVWKHEPETPTRLRFLVRLLCLLPLESQL